MLLFCISAVLACLSDYPRLAKEYACSHCEELMGYVAENASGIYKKMICLRRMPQNIVRNAEIACILSWNTLYCALFCYMFVISEVGSEPIVWIEWIWLPELLDVSSVCRSARKKKTKRSYWYTSQIVGKIAPYIGIVAFICYAGFVDALKGLTVTQERFLRFSDCWTQRQ